MIMLNIEPTDFCNAKCLYCIQSERASPHPSRGGLLSVEVHKKVLDGLEDFLKDPLCAPARDNVVCLRYCGVGEPTLHPHFIDMYRLALLYPKIKITAILSNGTGWNKRFTDAFIESSLERKDMAIELVFSLDTLREETQFKIKQLRNIDSIVENLRYLLDSIAKAGLKNIHPVFQMIVLKENFIEAEAFVDFWKTEIEKRGLSWRLVREASYTKHFQETCAFIWLRCLDGGSQEGARDLHTTVLAGIDHSCDANSKSITPAIQQGEEPCPLASKPVCGVMWYGINVAASGDVSPCCIDIDFQLKIGNVRSDILSEMYLSGQMIRLRQAHMQGELKDYPVCRSCNFLHFSVPAQEEDVCEYQSVGISRGIFKSPKM